MMRKGSAQKMLNEYINFVHFTPFRQPYFDLNVNKYNALNVNEDIS